MSDQRFGLVMARPGRHPGGDFGQVAEAAHDSARQRLPPYFRVSGRWDVEADQQIEAEPDATDAHLHKFRLKGHLRGGCAAHRLLCEQRVGEQRRNGLLQHQGGA